MRIYIIGQLACILGFDIMKGDHIWIQIADFPITTYVSLCAEAIWRNAPYLRDSFILK